jgi:hypothetical protein
MAISPTDIRILITNYDIITYFLNLAFCSEHFISIKHCILATFNINKKILFWQSLTTDHNKTIYIHRSRIIYFLLWTGIVQLCIKSTIICAKLHYTKKHHIQLKTFKNQIPLSLKYKYSVCSINLCNSSTLTSFTPKKNT